MVHGSRSVLETELTANAWQAISESPRRLVMVEYDGVLAPYSKDRGHAAAREARLAALVRIIQSPANHVVVMAGRSLQEIEELLRPWTLDLVGEHGWEEHLRESERVIHPLPAPVAQRLGQATRVARASGYEPLLERKRCSVVLHTRGIPGWEAEEAEETCRALWARAYERDGLRLHPIDCGLELRAIQRHEGVAVADWIVRTGSALPIYIGAAATGLLAFRRVRGAGVNIQVGGFTRSPLSDAWLTSDDHVERVLEEFATL